MIGKSGRRRCQGLLAPEILITKAHRRERHPDTLPHAVVEFCNWCLRDAGLLREEVQADAWPIYYTSLYLGEVANGGHGQFAGNTGMDPFVVQAVERGLDILGLDGLSGIFEQFTSALLGDSALKSSVMDGGGFGDIPPLIDALDSAFFESTDRAVFAFRASAWLRRNPHVSALTPRQKKTRERAIIDANLLLTQRRRAATKRRPLEMLSQAARDLWDLTGLRRLNESRRAHLMRRYAALPLEWPDLVETEMTLLQRRYDAALEDDAEEIDTIIAEYRDVHLRYELHTKDRWEYDLSSFGGRLLSAGVKLGRLDLLAQAADTFGQAISAAGVRGSTASAHDWQYLGEALVEIARLDETAVPALPEALDAFDQAIVINSKQDDISGRWGLELGRLGRAEALILLSAYGQRGGDLAIARDLLCQVRDPVTYPGKQRNAAAYAELLIALPTAEVSESDRRRARRRLDIALARELDNDGAVWACSGRLERLCRLRADVRLS